MATFHYIAKDPKGRMVSGEMDAPDAKMVATTLRDHQLVIFRIQERKVKRYLPSIKFLDRVTSNDVLNFTRQFAIMITSGLPITESLSIIKAQTAKQSYTHMIESIYKDVQSGQSLAVAFERFPKVFPATYVALVRAGEASGLLDQIFPRLSETLEKQKEFKSKTKGALVYPVIVLIGMAIVVFIMMVFVIPKLSSLYSSLGSDLPLPTLILIKASALTTKLWWLMILLAIGAVVGFLTWRRTPKGSALLDMLFFRVPIFGSLRRGNILTEMTRTLGLLASSGVPIIESLQIVSKTTGSVHYEEKIMAAAQNVEKGFTLAQSVEDPKYFPQIVTFMVRTGEETGKVGEVLLKLAHFFEIETEQKIKNLTVAMEPIIMIILGVGVGFLILSIILPIYKLTSSF